MDTKLFDNILDKIKELEKLINLHAPQIDELIKLTHDQILEDAYMAGYSDGLKQHLQSVCTHPETTDVGDTDHLAVVCTNCELVL